MASSVIEQTISNVKNPKISMTSSLGSESHNCEIWAHSSNLLAFLKVNEACLHSDQWTYSSLVMFLVSSSAIFNRFNEARVAAFSSSSICSASSGVSRCCSENMNCTSQGSSILDFLYLVSILVESVAWVVGPAAGASFSINDSGPPLSWSLAFFRTSFQERYVSSRLTLALSCSMRKMTSSGAIDLVPRKAAVLVDSTKMSITWPLTMSSIKEVVSTGWSLASPDTNIICWISTRYLYFPSIA